VVTGEPGTPVKVQLIRSSHRRSGGDPDAAARAVEAETRFGVDLYRELVKTEHGNLFFSPHSIDSKWVRDEIRRARKSEVREQRRKLFPIRLCDFDAIRDWEAFDADTGKDLAVEIREYFVPDFSTWKDHDAFEAAYARLKRDLRLDQAEEPPGVRDLLNAGLDLGCAHFARLRRQQ
jgi:hypothetical protein